MQEVDTEAWHMLVDQMLRTVVCPLCLASSEKGPLDESEETQTQTIDAGGRRASFALLNQSLGLLFHGDRSWAGVREKMWPGA